MIQSCPSCGHARTLSHFSCVQLFVTLWTVACQAPLSTTFSRQEYWSGWTFPSFLHSRQLPTPTPGIFLIQGSKLHLLYLYPGSPSSGQHTHESHYFWKLVKANSKLITYIKCSKKKQIRDWQKQYHVLGCYFALQ